MWRFSVWFSVCALFGHALVCPAPSRRRLHSLRGRGDDIYSGSAAYDVADGEGWPDEGDETDAGVRIHFDRDCIEEQVDATTYFFGSEDDDLELRRLLAELEDEFAAKDDSASRLMVESVRSCGELLDEEASDGALDARAALAFASTAREGVPEDEALDERGGSVVEAAGLLSVEDEAEADEPLDEHIDNMYGWMLNNLSTGGTGGADGGEDAAFRRAERPSGGVSVGIDLGTTNSAAAVVLDGVARLIPPGLMPSVVCFVDPSIEGSTFEDEVCGHVALRDDEGSGVVVLVGAPAERMRGGVHGASVCSRIKRVLARDATHSERRRVGASEETAKGVGAVTMLKIPALPNKVAACEVSAEVVRQLLRDCEVFLGEGHVRRCVVGVPARFDEVARAATVTAVLLAGFQDCRLISEPEAAALAYGAARLARRRKAKRARDTSLLSESSSSSSSDEEGDCERCVLVFDLGGGTFDASVVVLRDSNATLVSLGGDAKLGGDDFDAVLAEHLTERFFDAHGVAVRAPSARLRLLAEAERCKLELSSKACVVAKARGLARVSTDGERRRGGKPLDLDAPITRKAFELLSRPLLKRIERSAREVCADAGVALPPLPRPASREADYSGDACDHDPTPRHLDSVLLVGGATRMPAVGRMLRKLTGLPLSKIVGSNEVHPDEAVALGCAIKAAALDREFALDATLHKAEPLFDFVPAKRRRAKAQP